MKKGSIALTTVIVLTGILLLGGITLTLNSIDLSSGTKDYFARNLAETRLRSCIEESLLKLKSNQAFAGNVVVTYSDGNCTSVISNESATVKILTITSTVDEYTLSEIKRVDISTDPDTLLN